MENGYLKNNNLTKLHSWEYYFGTIVFINNGILIGIKNQKLKIHKFQKLKSKIKYSVINQPFKKPTIAIFMLPPGGSPDSGGYRTLLKYINIMNENGYSLDIYFGICWNDKDVFFNVNDINKDGMPSCQNWMKQNDYNKINELIENIKKYNEINVKKIIFI